MSRKLLPLLALGLALSACRDEPEAIPAYLELQPFTVNAPGGAADHKITEGWLYVNNEFLGAYSLPSTVPVLAEGESTIYLYAGVRENGIAQTPNIYPLFERHEQTSTLAPNETTVVAPVTRYTDDATFPWEPERSTFDDAGIPLDPPTDYELTTDGAYDGRSVRIRVDTTDATDAIATNLIPLPNNGERQVWLELHYRNDIPFALFLQGESGQLNRFIYQFNTSAEWNKIYINLTEFIAQPPAETRYKIAFVATLSRNLQGQWPQPTGTVLLDNLKIVHF